MNGKNATVVHNTDGTITLTDISTVTVPSDPVAVKKIDTVKAANATLTCKAGEKPKFTATIPEGEERYEIVYESWSDGTTTIRSDSADSDFTFEAGKTYKYSIAFRLTEKGIADGYDLTGAKLTLNGKESGVSITESGKTAEYMAMQLALMFQGVTANRMILKPMTPKKMIHLRMMERKRIPKQTIHRKMTLRRMIFQKKTRLKAMSRRMILI